MASLVAKAYFQPINPDWREPDPWRDSIIAVHYFDYFNPADSFYLHTNILTEKMEIYLSLKTNKKDEYGRLIQDEVFLSNAAQEFLEQTKQNSITFTFCLNYFLNTFAKAYHETAFMNTYNAYLKTEDEDCGTLETDVFSWARKKVDAIHGVQIGNLAPDFLIYNNQSLNSLKSDYTLLLFWSSWCTHCTQEVPKIKHVVDEFNLKPSTSNSKLITVAVSLDTEVEPWQKFITDNNLFSFLNFSDFKSWQSEVVKKYNVHATPTMFLLNKDKKIIAKPEASEELRKVLKAITR